MFIVVPIKINIVNIMVKTSTSEEDYFSTETRIMSIILNQV